MTEPLTTLAPVVREIDVRAPAATCFRVFVEEFTTWWPVEHHIGADRTIVEFRIEPVVGGRCYDVDTAGGLSQWGTVLAIDPPQRFVFAWHVQGDWTIDPDPLLQSEVEVTFEPTGDDTTHVRVEHRHLDRHRGAAGAVAGISSPGGWTTIVARFGDVVEGRPPGPIPTD